MEPAGSSRPCSVRHADKKLAIRISHMDTKSRQEKRFMTAACAQAITLLKQKSREKNPGETINTTAVVSSLFLPWSRCHSIPTARMRPHYELAGLDWQLPRSRVPASNTSSLVLYYIDRYLVMPDAWKTIGKSPTCGCVTRLLLLGFDG